MKRIPIGLLALLALAGACGPLAGLGLGPTEPPPQTAGQVASVPFGLTPTPGAATLDATPLPAGPPTAAYDPFADARPLGSVGFAIPPTVQHVTETTVEILFQFELPQAGALLYQPLAEPPGAARSLPLDPSSARHAIRLEGLTPASSYQFVVRAGAGAPETLEDVPFQDELWGAQTFRTPPYGEPLRFAVIGDSGFAEPVTFALAEQMAAFDPHFVLHVGDVVYRVENYADPYAAFQAAYYAPFKPVLQRAPLYPVVGNHDLDAPTRLSGLPFYYLAFPPIVDPAFPDSTFEGQRQWYAFAAGDVQFIGLNTQVFFGQPGRQELLAWLEERLADPRFAYSIAFFHVPPYSSALHEEEGDAVGQVAALLEGAGVPVAFSGHEHVYERLSVGPTTYFISGGGSGSLYHQGEGDPNSQFFVSQSHTLQVEVTSEHIEVRAVAVDGSLIDQVSLPTPP